MIKITLGTATSRTEVFVNETEATPKSVFKENGASFETATNYLDGATLSAADMNKTFEELGVSETAALISVTKLTNN